MLYLRLKPTLRVPLAAFGALLQMLLVPLMITLGRALDAFHIQMGYALLAIPVGMALYYLVWKFAVGALNNEMGIG